MFPSRSTIEKMILEILVELGEKGKIIDIYQRLSKKSSLSESELLEKVPSGENRWKNNVRWARANLINKGLMEKRREYGVWEISQKGISYYQERILKER
jgi:restriction system protein